MGEARHLSLETTLLMVDKLKTMYCQDQRSLGILCTTVESSTNFLNQNLLCRSLHKDAGQKTV